MKIAYQKYPLVGNYTHPWVLLTIIIKVEKFSFEHYLGYFCFDTA